MSIKKTMQWLTIYKCIAALLAGLLPALACADIYLQEDVREEIYLTNLVGTESVPNAQHAYKASGSNKRFKLLVAEETLAANAGLPITARIINSRIIKARPITPRTERQGLPFSQAVRLAAANTSLEPALLHAVMTVESNNNPQAISPRGARGLMQLMPATSKRYLVTNPHDPGQNITAGARYLQALQHRFNGDTRLALAAYNAGPGAVVKSGYKIPPFSETQHYVPRVMQLYQKLQEAEELRGNTN